MKSENEIAESGINPESWRPLLELATREVFEIMLGSKLETSEATECIPLEFMAMVGLAGELRGVLSLRCTSKSAAIMASKMLGLEPDAVGEQMWDATGEIANMIAGNFKNKLTGMGDRCVLSVPTVITGSDYNCHSLTDSGALEVFFLFESSLIDVTLEVHS
jgi:chemotaxis protein CheX